MTNEEITIRQAREPDLERMTQIFIENQKNNAPPTLKSVGLIGACF